MATTAGASAATPPVPPTDKGKRKATGEPKDDKGEYPTRNLETVLVTGGCGFFGTYLVEHLVNDPEVGPIFVIDKDIRNVHNHPSVQYIRCNITDAKELEAVLDRARPKVIFHTASPNGIYARRCGFWRGEFYRTNVTGTENLIRLSKRKDSTVKVLVYTSSASVYNTDQQSVIRETAPTYTGRPWPWEGVCEHTWTKGVAHNMVLDEDESWRQGGLKTVVIVPATMYGVGDSQALPLIFDAFQNERTPVLHAGKTENTASFVDGASCAALHIVAAKDLVSGRKDVAGEAYNVTDGLDVLVWWHVGITIAAIRGLDDAAAAATRCRRVPAWFMCIAVYVTWWAFLIFTLGYMEPPLVLSIEGYEWCTKDRKLDIRRAQKVLGYEPRSDRAWHEAVVRAAVEVERERRRIDQLEMERRAIEEQERKNK